MGIELLGSAIGAGASLLGSSQAADAQADAAAQAAQTQMKMFKQQRADQLPFLNTAYNADAQLGALYGLDGYIPEAEPAPQQFNPWGVNDLFPWLDKFGYTPETLPPGIGDYQSLLDYINGQRQQASLSGQPGAYGDSVFDTSAYQFYGGGL